MLLFRRVDWFDSRNAASLVRSAARRDTISMREITSRHNPIVRLFREAADDPDSSGARLLLDGAHLVREAHDAHLAFASVVVAASRLATDTEEGRLAAMLERGGVDVTSASDHVFAAISPVRTPSGIVAVVNRRPSSIDTMCGGGAAFVLVVIDVQDPGNVGAIVRVAEAAGATGVLVCGTSANPFSWKALRGSMGSLLRMPTVSRLPIDTAIAHITSAGLRTVAAVARDGRDPDAIDWSGPTAVLLGGEGPGLTHDLAARCDERVTIPMSRPVESLNVSAAAAILVYAARRQREGGRT